MRRPKGRRGNDCDVPNSAFVSRSAVVDDAGDFGAEVLAVDDAIDETHLQQEFAGLKIVREFLLHGGGDDAWASEPDEPPLVRQA